MMHGSVSERVTVGGVRPNAEIFGGRDEGPLRVAVAVPVFLSFSELLGLLVFSGSLMFEELDDERAVCEVLQAALVLNDLPTIEVYADRAMLALAGRPWPADVEAVPFVRAVARTVTHVFGLTAPDQTSAAAGAVAEVEA